MRHQCFAVCAPGLEPFVAQELVGLGIRRSHVITGGVTFDATSRQLYAANVWLRTATRVLVRIGRFRARDFAQLELGSASIDWDYWVRRRRGLTFRVSSVRSRLYHTAAIEQRLRRVLEAEDDAGDAQLQQQGQLVVVRLADDQATISIDASGDPLYKRGWRLASSKAPLRETLAASMVLAAEWQPDLPLVDPFAGSGTIAIEAALIAAGRAPGAQRSFAFQDWPSFEPGTFASVRATVDGDADRDGAPIIARDRDAGAVATTIANAERAGVAARIDAQRASVSDLGDIADPRAGWIITNPPYGKRVSKGDDLRDLFARFGDVARTHLAGWHVGLLVADSRVAGHARISWHEQFQTRNGGIPVSYVTGEVSARPVPSGPRRGRRKPGP